MLFKWSEHLQLTFGLSPIFKILKKNKLKSYTIPILNLEHWLSNKKRLNNKILILEFFLSLSHPSKKQRNYSNWHPLKFELSENWILKFLKINNLEFLKISKNRNKLKWSISTYNGSFSSILKTYSN